MIENLIKYRAPFNKRDTLQVLACVLCCTFMIWLLKYHWDRRKLYRFAWTVQGPPTYPIIGSELVIMKNSAEIFSKMLEIFDAYPEVTKLWLGNKLVVVISKPELMEIILNNPHCLQKDALYKFTEPMGGTGLFSAPVHKWKKNRKLISPAFNQKILDTFVDIFAEQANIFVDILCKRVGEKDLDVFPLISSLTLDSLCESTMGIKVGAQGNSSKLGEWIDTALMAIFIKMVVVWYHFEFIFNLTKLSKVLRESITNVHQFTQKVVRERRQLFEEKIRKLKIGEEIEEEPSRRKNLLDLLLELTHNGTRMTDEELRQEVDTFTVAGTDTSASTIGFCFTMLGMHQDIQQKILQEVVDVVGEEREVTADDLPRFNLLERFIKETLRLFPIGPFILRAVNTDVDIGECVIPAGCSVAVGIIKVQRNEKYWKDPLKFDPDRFLPEEILKRHPYCYLPFSGGPRNCIGAKYAMMSMKTILATVIRRFLIKTEYKSVEDIKLKANIVLKPRDGYRISVQLREQA